MNTLCPCYVPVAHCSWPSRAFTEPPGPGEHVLHRAGRARTVLARQARCSMAFVPSASPTLFRGAPVDALYTPHAQHCTHWFAVRRHSVVSTERSATVRHASACNEHVVHLGSINARCTPAQEQRDTVSTSSASWQSGARVAVAVTGDAGLMAEAPSSGLSSAVCRLGLGAWGLRWAMAMAVGRPPRQAASGRCRRALGEQIAFRICNVFHHGRNVTRQVCTSMFDRAVEIV